MLQIRIQRIYTIVIIANHLQVVMLKHVENIFSEFLDIIVMICRSTRRNSPFMTLMI